MELQDAKVLITGGTTGIGFETARLLTSKGAQVVFCGQNAERVAKAAAELGITGFTCDISDAADVERLFEKNRGHTRWAGCFDQQCRRGLFRRTGGHRPSGF
ncbi:SDR family NAD(P)-dependent oxidoreductase [Flavobacterium sp. HJ-32-4]|uniref:SDR family NAD(P)-dependent oxidoreductase n=1 Tax=Flavobacterium sp. HJ-32-4 TaxID=1160795 RepID=UPI0035301333